MSYSSEHSHKKTTAATRSAKEMSDIEDAFKTDFTKKPPSFSCKASLLTTMFTKQHNEDDEQRPEEEEDDEDDIVIEQRNSSSSDRSNSNGELSASLKQNVDWEHQTAYSIKPADSNYTQIDWNDNFSRW